MGSLLVGCLALGLVELGAGLEVGASVSQRKSH